MGPLALHFIRQDTMDTYKMFLPAPLYWWDSNSLLNVYFSILSRVLYPLATYIINCVVVVCRARLLFYMHFHNIYMYMQSYYNYNSYFVLHCFHCVKSQLVCTIAELQNWGGGYKRKEKELHIGYWSVRVVRLGQCEMRGRYVAFCQMIWGRGQLCVCVCVISIQLERYQQNVIF